MTVDTDQTKAEEIGGEGVGGGGERHLIDPLVNGDAATGGGSAARAATAAIKVGCEAGLATNR